MSAKKGFLSKNFLFYAGVGIFAAAIPFGVNYGLNGGEPYGVKNEIISKKVHKSVDDQIKQAIDGGVAATTSFTYNIHAQETVDVDAVNAEIPPLVAQKNNEKLEATLKTSALLGSYGIFMAWVGMSRRRREDSAPK